MADQITMYKHALVLLMPGNKMSASKDPSLESIKDSIISKMSFESNSASDFMEMPCSFLGNSIEIAGHWDA